MPQPQHPPAMRTAWRVYVVAMVNKDAGELQGEGGGEERTLTLVNCLTSILPAR